MNHRMLFAAAALAAWPVGSEAAISVAIDVAPPPLPVYVQPVIPAPGEGGAPHGRPERGGAPHENHPQRRENARYQVVIASVRRASGAGPLSVPIAAA